jgi:hypothetical protein
MQIIELDLDDWNLFCPLTGQKVFTEDPRRQESCRPCF